MVPFRNRMRLAAKKALSWAIPIGTNRNLLWPTDNLTPHPRGVAGREWRVIRSQTVTPGEGVISSNVGSRELARAMALVRWAH